jgi:aryl-alcohol dehydrogenase-like predicted oxidoreductase
MATAQGTFDYKERHDGFARTYFRRVGDRAVSSIGLGTYLGDPDDETDAAYRAAIDRALASGVNVLDTAINYRHQRSERCIGTALADSDVPRDSVFVATKGGFVPFDRTRPDDPSAYIRTEYLDTDILHPNDLAHGSHAIAPAFVREQLARSRDNLGLDTIDLYYVHNPETQLDVRSRAAVYDQLEATFEVLERRAATGDLRHYGVATWDAFRVPRSHDHYLSLAEIIERARTAAQTAGNAATHFRAIQVPFNVYMADAFTVEAQPGPAGDQSVLWFAQEAGLNVFTSASLAQGDVLDGIPQSVDDRLAGETLAQRGLNFARSAPGVTCALTGMATTDHVRENVAAGRYEPMGADSFDAVFE